uniref:ATP-sensitive inward rectifier potassium channel 11-like n=1 Tax=Myxine glutinosa TaxID=7769 RepID=UPI00358FECA1
MLSRHSFIFSRPLPYPQARSPKPTPQMLGRRIRRPRFVAKGGAIKVAHKNIQEEGRFLMDVFTTLVDMKWSHTLVIFTSAFLSSWLLFALFWWLLAFGHGDLEGRGRWGRRGGVGGPRVSSADEDMWPMPCVTGLHSFASAFLFSVEVQVTIGFGGRMLTEQCPAGLVVLVLQNICGLATSAVLLGCVFMKTAEGRRRAGTILFSRNATIAPRGDCLALSFRLGDLRRSLILSATLRLILLRSPEGSGSWEPQHLRVDHPPGGMGIFLVAPIVVVHIIGPDSPLFDLDPHNLLQHNVELVVLLEGVAESTGITTQARTSYLPEEILWGRRFVSLVTREDRRYAIDYYKFGHTVSVPTPRCSAREFSLARNLGHATPVRSRGFGAPMSEHVSTKMRRPQFGGYQVICEDDESEEEDDSEGDGGTSSVCDCR